MALPRTPEQPRHLVVVVGGAVAGSEAAWLCAERGASVVVLEQNDRPFGKIEDGLPRWHDKLRLKEYERIVTRLSHPDVLFVPETTLGREVTLEELLDGWQASAVLLASGAWRDRPLPVEGADAFVDRGLVYQNPFVHWYNHYPEEGYDGPVYEVPDGPVVVGGGLASIDVAKILNLQLYKKALAERGHRITTQELEHSGIPTAVEASGHTLDDLGVRGATLYYRRSKREMPLASAPPDADEAQLEKMGDVRERLMDKVTDRYLVHFVGNRVPVGVHSEGDRLTGLRFQRTETVAGKLRPVADAFEDVSTDLVVSSIGSIPQPIPGLPMQGELIDFADWDTGRVSGFDRVHGLGNALTGKGNIKASRKNAVQIAEYVASRYLGVAEGTADMAGAHERARAATEATLETAVSGKPLSPAQLSRAFEAVSVHWRRTGYEGHLAAWIAKVMPQLSE